MTVVLSTFLPTYLPATLTYLLGARESFQHTIDLNPNISVARHMLKALSIEESELGMLSIDILCLFCVFYFDCLFDTFYFVYLITHFFEDIVRKK